MRWRPDWFRVGIICSLIVFWALVIAGVWLVCRIVWPAAGA